MSEPVYRRGRQQFYLRPRSHSWIGTFLNPFFGVPVCDARSVDLAAQALVLEVMAYAESMDTAAPAMAGELVSVGAATDTSQIATAGEVC